MIDRPIQKVTSFYGPRENSFHKGIDLRSVDIEGQTYSKQAVILPVKAKFIRSVFQEKWSWTAVFYYKSYTLKFVHLQKPLLEKRFFKYNKNTIIGYTGVTPYMISHKYGEHLHFETWHRLGNVDINHFDPLNFYDEIGVDYG